MIGTARFSLFERNWKKKKRSNEQVQGVFRGRRKLAVSVSG
jgi:hypothetical protein